MQIKARVAPSSWHPYKAVPKEWSDPVSCDCGGVALYRWNDKGYCRNHREQASAAMAKTTMRYPVE